MNLLIIDDDLFTRKLLSHQLLELGYNVSSAENGEEALKILETNKNFDALLVDVVMPMLSGPSFLIKLKYHFKVKKPQIIVITGMHNGADFLQKMGTEYNYLLEKPINIAQLKNILKEVEELKKNENP